MSEEQQGDGGEISLRVAYMDGGTGFLTQVMHGGPTSKITLAFEYDAGKDSHDIIFGNIPSFGGDAQKQVDAMLEVIEVLRSIVASEEILENIRESLEEEADDEERELDDEEE